MLFSSKMWKTLWGAEYSAEQNFPPGAQENPSQLDGWPGAAVVRWLPSRLPPWTLAHGSCTRTTAGGAMWFKCEIFATLSLSNQNKSHGSSSLSVGRGNSSWREEERKTFAFELLLGHFAPGGTAAVIQGCCSLEPHWQDSQAEFQLKAIISKKDPLYLQTWIKKKTQIGGNT